MLRYVEPVVIEQPLESIPSRSMACADSRRHISVTEIPGKKSFAESPRESTVRKFSAWRNLFTKARQEHVPEEKGSEAKPPTPIALVRRKCSYWKYSKTGKGFTLIVLCDPPLRRVYDRDATRKPQSIRTSLYRQGYVDFLSQEDQWEAATEIFTHENGEATPMLGPPRTSLLEDLQYYLSGRGAQLAGCQDISDRALCFIHKLVAVHYLQLGLCSHTIVASLQWELSMKKNMCTDGVLDDAESQWCSVQAMERRLAEYCIDIHEIMLTLGIPLDLPDTSRCETLDTWMNVIIDFQFLRIHFQNLRHRAEQLNSATTGLTGIAGNRQAQHEQKIALREAQRTKALTLVGLIFIPLAYTATLFSMEEQYMPGAKDFWIYFAVAAPLILVVILGYLALDEAFEKLIWFKSQKLPAPHAKASHEERQIKDAERGGQLER